MEIILGYHNVCLDYMVSNNCTLQTLLWYWN